jgi:stage II sporulation protein R
MGGFFMLNLINRIKNEKKTLAFAFAAGLLITAVYGLYGSAGYAADTQKGIADSILRLHVLANSDSEDDQRLKLLVRDGVLDVMKGFLDGDEGKDEVTELVADNMGLIIDKVNEIVAANGFEYDISAGFSYERFPAADYGGIVLPTGRYDALRIEIGGGAGRNWWCVAFPPLCFVDAALPKDTRAADGHDTPLRNVLTAEQYDLLHAKGNGTRLQARFWVVEFWMGRKG